eukprot:616785-Rhodomonas_salina.1
MLISRIARAQVRVGAWEQLLRHYHATLEHQVCKLMAGGGGGGAEPGRSSKRASKDGWEWDYSWEVFEQVRAAEICLLCAPRLGGSSAPIDLPAYESWYQLSSTRVAVVQHTRRHCPAHASPLKTGESLSYLVMGVPFGGRGGAQRCRCVDFGECGVGQHWRVAVCDFVRFCIADGVLIKDDFNDDTWLVQRAHECAQHLQLASSSASSLVS